MTPEELKEIRSTLEFASQAGAKDEFMDTTFNLLEFIDEQAAQIEALKEKLIEAVAKQFDVDEPCIGRTHFEYCELMGGSCDGYPHMWETCPRKKQKLDDARQQIKAEMPGVEWE